LNDTREGSSKGPYSSPWETQQETVEQEPDIETVADLDAHWLTEQDDRKRSAPIDDGDSMQKWAWILIRHLSIQQLDPLFVLGV